MTGIEYAWAAVDIVIDYALEQGVKYRRGDFKVVGVKKGNADYHKLNPIYVVGGLNEPQGITVTLLYDYERTGKKLKAIKDGFLCYKYCRVRGNAVYFHFSLNEIEIQSSAEIASDTSKMEDVIRKVQKLFALSDQVKNPSEHEAIAASMQAQKLLAKYNIDIASVTGVEKQEEIEQVIADVGTGKKWKYMLANIVADSYCCKCFYHGAEMIVFYGFQSDVLIARSVFVYLFRVGNSLASKYVKERRDAGIFDTSGIYNSFCSGFCSGVKRELQKNCTALALITPKKVVEDFEKFTEKFKVRNSKINTNDIDAYSQGEVEGKRALNARYIEGSSPNDD